MSILFDEFSSICLYLNKIGIVPTLMGSLGLEFISKEDWKYYYLKAHESFSYPYFSAQQSFELT